MDEVNEGAAGKGDDFLHEVREKFDRAAEWENDNRLRALDDVKFARLNEHWPWRVKKQREDDGRPCLVIPKLPSFIRQVVNSARRNKPGINVVPADSSGDVKTAEIMSGLIRNIEVTSDAEVAYDTAVEWAVSAGWGYFRINIDYSDDDSFDKDICIERIDDPFTVYGDPDSRSADSADWNCCWVVSMLSLDAFQAKYKGKEAVDWDGLGYTGLPAPWRDGDSVMVCEYWHREDVERTIYMLGNGEVVGEDVFQQNIDILAPLNVVGERQVKSKKVTQYIMTGAEVLETVEWPGKYIPIVPVYGDEITIEGKRYFKSLIHDAKDAQRELNYWRSMAAETVALAPKAPFIGPVGAFNTDIQKWATANDAAHAFIEYDGPIQPQRQGYAGPPAAEMQQAMSATADMKEITGIYDPSLGAPSNETSGVAIARRQGQSDVSNFHFIDNLSRAIRHAGRIILDLIPRVYSTTRIVRVLGEDMKPQNVQVAPQEQQQELAMEAQQMGRDLLPMFDLAAGKYDLVVKSGPSYGTQREYVRDEIVEIMRSFPPSAPVLGPMYLRNSDWPGAEEAAEKLEAMTGGEGGDPRAQQQMMQAQAQMAQLQAENQALKQANDIKLFEAQTKRMEAEIKAQEIQVKAQADLMAAQQQRVVPPPSNPFGLG